MRQRILLVSLLLVATFAVPPTATASATQQSNCSFPVSKVDATGTSVTLDEEPQRVVTLSPSAAQIMWEIGAKDKVVGVTQYASYLDGANEKTNVSGTGESFANIEKVVSLEPDLVLAPNSVSKETVKKLRDAGLTVYYYRHAASLEDVYRDTTVTGTLVGECSGAGKTVSWMKDRIGTVQQAVNGEQRPDALYLFYGYTSGEGTFINQIIQTAGGNNVAAEVGISDYQQISKEVVVKQDPDWIILNNQDPSVPDEAGYRNLSAVQENRTIEIPIEYMNQPAPRMVYAVTNLTKRFYPDAYAAANSSITDTTTATSETTTKTASAPAESEETMTTESNGQPGFGVTSVVVAMLGTLLFVRRWQ
ncbi:iron complex transport system substrate-binding protein [Haladaptatus litoreus]|uniref:Iron complex transport system substrate-binding protein n=1 Tax=Haladaptatus litoreus TaxID=553468 RepID=A0A1N7CSS3_9EURY|nr:PGF-CTERM-anchored ABC transporter substrate-binding protein [Haladaptatus litoreus]SIR66590.1 iron complex transport system substrate-binding protein [Haladaptatus litoreus]